MEEGSRTSHKLTVVPGYPHRWPCGGPGGEPHHLVSGAPITVRRTGRLSVTSQLHVETCQKMHCLPCLSALTKHLA